MGAVRLPDNLAKETPTTNINRQRLSLAIIGRTYTETHTNTKRNDTFFKKKQKNTKTLVIYLGPHFLSTS